MVLLPMGDRGKVYFVGAGLGSPLDLTVRAWHLLRQAEVAIVDDLVSPEILDLLPASCDRLWVGKRGGQASTPQAEIDRLVIDRCRAGQAVIRLKSGDPGIFGRLVQEIRALQIADCPYEIVPGLSSAIVGPLAAGIPLTDRDLSRAFAVVTAHDCERLSWSALAEMDVLVFLMGTRSLAQICTQLLAAGKPAQTPIALIRAAGRSEQTVWTGVLASFAESMADKKNLSPAAIVVGETVQLRDELLGDCAMEAETRPSTATTALGAPLFGKTVLVTRANSQSGGLTQQLQTLGATVVEMPTLEIVPPSDIAALDLAITQLDSFDWLVLASGNGVTSFFNRLQELGLDSRALHAVKVAAVGKKTSDCLAERGVTPDFVPDEFVADALAAQLPLSEEGGDRVLFPRVESGGRPTLVKQLGARGAEVTEVAAYQSRCPLAVDPVALQLLQRQQIDALTFASSKTVVHFHQLLQQAGFDFELLSPVKVAAIGPKTAETCNDLLGRTDICAAEYTIDGLVAAVAKAFKPALPPQ